MKNYRLILAILLVVLVVGGLIYSSVMQTSKLVITVDELMASKKPIKHVRVGARVTEDKIDYRTSPDFLLHFVVKDITASEHKMDVAYRGMMPDTLKAGRDVILEGDYDGTSFDAKSLLTQCPSKYEPPLPGTASGTTGSAGNSKK